MPSLQGFFTKQNVAALTAAAGADEQFVHGNHGVYDDPLQVLLPVADGNEDIEFSAAAGRSAAWRLGSRSHASNPARNRGKGLQLFRMCSSMM